VPLHDNFINPTPANVTPPILASRVQIRDTPFLLEISSYHIVRLVFPKKGHSTGRKEASQCPVSSVNFGVNFHHMGESLALPCFHRMPAAGDHAHRPMHDARPCSTCFAYSRTPYTVATAGRTGCSPTGRRPSWHKGQEKQSTQVHHSSRLAVYELVRPS
jgi:hypothetical protein